MKRWAKLPKVKKKEKEKEKENEKKRSVPLCS
jgi:hypothetical protein